MLAMRPRPPVLAAIAFVFGPPIALFAFAMALCEPESARARVDVVVPAPTVADSCPWPRGMILAPPRIDGMPMPTIAPEALTDARDWPHGMVMGRQDTVLSGLFAPLACALLAPGPALL